MRCDQRLEGDAREFDRIVESDGIVGIDEAGVCVLEKEGDSSVEGGESPIDEDDSDCCLISSGRFND